MADLALAAEALLELTQRRLDIGDRRVQLAGQEVPAAVVSEDLGQLAALLRDELEHQQERHDTGVGLREVAEVVVAGNLAAERGALFSHPVLDERVADAVD